MTTHTGVTSGRAAVGRPDGEYAFVAGLYAAALLAPALVLLLASVRSDAATLYVGFLLAVTGLTAIAGWVVSRIPGFASRLGRRDAVWLLVVLPFGWFAGAFGADAVHVDLPGVAVPLAVVCTAGGMLLGLMLVAMSRTRHADSVLERTTESAAWEARWPRRWRRVAAGVSVGAFAASAVGFVAAFGFGIEWGWRLYYLLFVGAVLMNVLNPRTFRVTDAGLVVENPLQRHFRPWSAFAGYELTDDALVIRSAARWRPDHRSDRADVEDVDAVVTALDEHLPRRGAPRRRGSPPEG
jgi:MFS family permease